MNLDLFETETQHLKKRLISLQEKVTALENSQKRAYTILSYIDDAHLLIDFDGMIIECTPPTRALFQRHLLGESFWDHFEDHFFGFSMKELLENKKEKKHLILTLLQEGEKKRAVELTTSFIPRIGLIITLRDRTGKEQLEHSAQENSQLRALGEMAATLAHEIRNPLGGIKGFASLLLEDMHNMPSQKTMVEAILEGTHLLNSLVTNVLEYAKPCQIHFTSLNLKKILEKQLLYLSPKEKERIVIHCPAEYTLMADESHFARALLNLIQNGLEASSTKKKVSLIAPTEGVLVIQDQGRGISKKNLDKIMTPFFTTKSKGTGLGLSEVHKILNAHGFTYKIDSSRKGTSVTIFYRGNNGNQTNIDR